MQGTSNIQKLFGEQLPSLYLRCSTDDRVEIENGGIASTDTIVNEMTEINAFDLMVAIQLRWFSMPSF